jgi:NAD(P)-dependent dehydrogenase (short-subunit alcohol dehydrogenase family)
MDYNSLFQLNKKKAIVVGSGGLLGLEIVKALLSQGATVLGLDIVKPRTKLKNFFFQRIDFSKLNKIETELEKNFKSFGVPDIFINASWPRTKKWPKLNFSESTIGELQKNVDIHLNSYIWSAKIIAEKMVKNKIKGSIILLGSMYGVVGQNMNIYKGTAMRENFAYSAIKGGIVNFTREMASYYGKNNIRSNVICPGGIEGHVAGLNSKQPEKFLRSFKETVPLCRLGKPHEIAASAIFLSSDASSYINGATIMVDGGWTAI